MQVPDFILRKLYKRGSLREVAPGRFAFTLHNPLATATLIGPPTVVVNGVAHRARDIKAKVDLAAINATSPHAFRKGDRMTLRMNGQLMRGANRIHIVVPTKEFGDVEIHVEDKEAEFCEMPIPGAAPRDEEE